MRLRNDGGTMYHDQGIAGRMTSLYKEVQVTTSWIGEVPNLRNNSIVLCPFCSDESPWFVKCNIAPAFCGKAEAA